MSEPRAGGFHRSVGEAMKTFGQARPSARKEAARAASGARSEEAVRERLYGKESRRR